MIHPLLVGLAGLGLAILGLGCLMLPVFLAGREWDRQTRELYGDETHEDRMRAIQERGAAQRRSISDAYIASCEAHIRERSNSKRTP